MKQGIYAIYDAQAECFPFPPFFQKTDGQATRSFIDLLQDDNSLVGKHAPDFTLYRIGNIDTDTGDITNYDNVSLGNALQFDFDNISQED